MFYESAALFDKFLINIGNEIGQNIESKLQLA